MHRLRLAVLGFSLAAAPLAVHAQAWSLDPAVAPSIVNDSSLLLNATFVAAPGGQFLVYGDFTHVNGTPAPGLARLGTDGKLDPTFAPDLAADERVLAIAPLPDGRNIALIGPGASVAIVAPPSLPPNVVVSTDVNGGVTVSDGTTGSGTGTAGPGTGVINIGPVGQGGKLIRLRADGRKDSAFTPLVVEGSVQLLALSDGRILVYGGFRSLGGIGQNSPARLNTDGTLDASFVPAAAARPPFGVNFAPGPDGTLFVSGPFSVTTVGGPAATGTTTTVELPIGPVGVSPPGTVVPPIAPPIPTSFLARLLINGSVDPQFKASAPTGTYTLLAAQPDGSVVAGSNGSAGLRRYTPTGAIDPAYTAQIPGLKSISRIVPLPSGRLAVEATVGAANAVGAPAVFTLAASGQLERDFRKLPGAREGQRLLATQPDGRVLVVQGTLVLNTSYYPVPFDTAAPSATTAIMPIFLGPVLTDPALAISPPDASAAPTTPLIALPTTITHRYSGSVNRIETDSAGRVLAAGTFTHIDGQPRAGLARFLASGGLDPAFAPTGGELLFAPPDGRVIVRRTTIGPVGTDGFHRYVTQIVRLQTDGSADPGFAFPAALDAAKTNWLTTAPDGRLLVAAFDPDATREENLKLIWLGADGRRLTTLPAVFTGFTRYVIMPMETTGALVPTELIPTIFPIGYGLPNVLDAAQLLADGRLLVAGAFSRVNGVARPVLARLQTDGTLDPTYAPDLALLNYRDTALPLPDGRALAFGNSVAGGRWQTRVLRLRADGPADPTFQPPPDTLASGARRLADGSFFSNGRRFFADGWPDLNFAPQLRQATSNGYASTAALTADGRLWLGGSFDLVNGQPRTALARFVPTEIAGITVSPASQKIVAGRDAFFQVAIGTAQPASYRWTFRNAALPNATTATLRLPAVRPDQAGVYRAIVTIGAQTFTSDPATLTVVPSTSRLINFSARSRIEPGSPPQIAGLVCTDAPPRPVLLRAVGRGLPATIGTVMLPVPVLTLYDGSRAMAEDRGGALAPAMNTLAGSVGAFPLSTTPSAPGAIYGSALSPTLGPGAFTAITTSGDGGSGVSLFECYDTGAESAPPLIHNVAIRGLTAPGASVLTAGFVIAGNGPLRVLVRGVGPALAQFGLPGAIADPRLDFFSSSWSTPLASNDGWAGAVELADAARDAGAFPFPAGSSDTALVLTLEPGAYTAQLVSAAGSTGMALIEIYIIEN